MKLALVMSGHFRTFDRTFQNLKDNVLDKYNPDVFLHSWTDSFGHYKHPSNQSDPSFIAGYDVNSDVPDSTFIDSVLDRLKPKSYVFENQQDYFQYFKDLGDKYSKYKMEHSERPKTVFTQNWARAKAIGLKNQYEIENDIKYDAVLWTRYDTIQTSPINLEDYEKNVLNLKPMENRNHEWIGDWWCYGPSYAFDIWANINYGVEELIAINKYTTVPHIWLYNWLVMNEVPYKIGNIPVALVR